MLPGERVKLTLGGPPSALTNFSCSTKKAAGSRLLPALTRPAAQAMATPASMIDFMDAVLVREAHLKDDVALAALRHELWPDSSAQEHGRELACMLAGEARGTLPSVILVAENAAGEIFGFIEAGLRFHADGCDQDERQDRQGGDNSRGYARRHSSTHTSV